MLRIAVLAGTAVLAIGTACPICAQTVYQCVPDEPRAAAPDRLVSVEITLKPNGEFASVVYRAANGTAYDRSKQYETENRQDKSGKHYWIGTLLVNRNVAMVGSFYRLGNRLIYIETVHDKLQRGKLVSQVKSICGGQPIAAEVVSPQAPAAPSPSVSYPKAEIMLPASIPAATADNTPLLLFGGTDHKTFLGCLNCSQYDSGSVCNQYGENGSAYSSTSIWNEYGMFGSQYSSDSPWNSYSSSAPIIVDQSGNSYGYFSANQYHPDRTRIAVFVRLFDAYEQVNDSAKIRDMYCGG